MKAGVSASSEAAYETGAYRQGARDRPRRANRWTWEALLCRSRQVVFGRVWLVPLLISLALSFALLDRKFGLFAVSFLGTANLQPLQIPLFLTATIIIDLTVLQTLAAGWACVCRVLRLRRRTFAFVFILCASTLVAVLNVLAYDIITYLGDFLRVEAAIHVAGGLSQALPYVLDNLPGYLPALALMVIVLLLGAAGLWRLSRGMPQLKPIPVAGPLRSLAVLWVLAITIEALSGSNGSNAVAVNLRRTCLGRIVAAGVSRLTDFDGDSHGWIDYPPDFAPFDARRHPFATDIPGNGIDENAIGGDLPAIVKVEGSEPALVHPASTPDVLLIVPCSLRSDVVFGGDIGPSVMPTLQRLAVEGFGTDRAFSHTGFTTSSLQTILSGRLVKPTRSLISEFKSYGYQVGVFLMQNANFGGTRQLCSLDDADYYFDAAMDVESRVTTYTAPSSLIIPFARVLPECAKFLAGAEPLRPMFMFVQMETTHYPYGHDSPRTIVQHVRLSRKEMTVQHRPELIQLYRNAAANLDAQIAELIALVEATRRRSQPVIIVIGEHGESLFDDGTLGHGIALSDVQMRVPLVIANGWGSVPVPFGLCDLRPFLLRMLSVERPANPVVTSHAAMRPVFQWIGPRWASHQIAHVFADGRVSVDLRKRTFTGLDGTVLPLSQATAQSVCLNLIRHWESLRIVP